MSECSKYSKLKSCQESAISGENQLKEDSSKDINEFWFSYRERRWNVKKGLRGQVKNKDEFFWTGEVEVWDYPACFISLVRASDKKLKIVVRRKKQPFFKKKSGNACNLQIRILRRRISSLNRIYLQIK